MAISAESRKRLSRASNLSLRSGGDAVNCRVCRALMRLCSFFNIAYPYCQDYFIYLISRLISSRSAMLKLPVACFSFKVLSK